MSSADNHNNTWSDADIQRYLKGELSAREMHELERAALDDPFLSDALEGLAGPNPGIRTGDLPVETDLAELKTRLAARVRGQEQRPALLWFSRPAFRVAAAAILLVGIGFTAWYTLLRDKSRQENPAFVKTTTVPPAKPVLPPPGQEPAGQPPAETRPAVQPPAKHERAGQPAATADSTRIIQPGAVAINRARRLRSAYSAEKREDQESHEAKMKDLAKNSERLEAADTTAGDRQKEDLLTRTAPAAAPALRPARIAKDSLSSTADASLALSRGDYTNSYRNFSPGLSPGQGALQFSGRVVDANNRPLAGASLFLNGAANIGTITDAHGKFNFKIAARDTAQQMTVALTGYQQTLISLNTNALTNNIIHLVEAKTNLDEVVVSGYGAQRKEVLAEAPSDSEERLDSAWLKVYPLIGKLAYQQYLAVAKRSLKLDSTIQGTERVSFQVDQKGQITNYKIEQSVSPAHDAGVIQLISNGPAWKLLHGRKARAVVSLSFP